MSLRNDETKSKVLALFDKGFNKQEIADQLGLTRQAVSDFILGKTWKDFDRGVLTADCLHTKGIMKSQAKILILDVELSPTIMYGWSLFNQNHGLNMIIEDFYIISFSAKWYGESEVFYYDKRDSWDNEYDDFLCEKLWQLMNEADIVVGQNSKKFDVKKINTRLLVNGFKPPSNYRQADTLEIAKRKFGFISNKLEYMTDKFCIKYKKLKHGKYAGFELWKECLSGNIDAWEEMEKYNIYDVLSTEELWTVFRPWDNKAINLGVYGDESVTTCNGCGSHEFSFNGFAYTNLSKFSKFVCNNCGWEYRDSINLIPKDNRKSIVRNIL